MTGNSINRKSASTGALSCVPPCKTQAGDRTEHNIKADARTPAFLCILLADDEGLDFFHQILAIICINFQCDRFGEIQTEDAQNGFAIHNMAPDPQVNVVRITVRDVYEGLDILGQAQLDVHRFHTNRLSCHNIRPY